MHVRWSAHQLNLFIFWKNACSLEEKSTALEVEEGPGTEPDEHGTCGMTQSVRSSFEHGLANLNSQKSVKATRCVDALVHYGKNIVNVIFTITARMNFTLGCAIPLRGAIELGMAPRLLST